MDAQELKRRLGAWLKTPQGTGLGLAAMIGFVMSGVVLLAFDPSPSSIGATATTIPIAESDEAARAYLEQAREYADKEDYQKAHNILRAIPEPSPVRELDEYRAVEDAWADFMLAKAAELDGTAEKLALLNRISETTSISPDKRQKAAEMALAIDPDETRPAGLGGATAVDDVSDAGPAGSE